MVVGTYSSWLRSRRDHISRAYRLLKGSEAPSPQVIEPGSWNALVLSPHPDDDVLGCGGTLKSIISRGGSARSIYLTDGGKGDPDIAREVLAETRKAEARNSAQILGEEDPVFLDHDDLSLQKDDLHIQSELEKWLKRLHPDAVFVPFFLDPHPDHVATCHLFTGACSGVEINPPVFTYEVWMPLMPNILVPIDDYMESKREAISRHESQLKHRTYLHSISGLAAYRAMTVPDCRYAEAFLRLNKDEYRKMISQKGLIA